jgi:hypothetical protein
MERRLASASRVLAALALVALAGCAPGLRTVTTPDGAFIYGFFAVPEKEGDVNYVGVIQAERVGIAGRAGCMPTSPEGLFFIEDVPPIRHNVFSFYVDGSAHQLGDMAKPFPVKPGELHLYGIYQYRKLSDPGIGRAGKFALTPTSRPSHAEVLRKLLQQQNISARWKRRIEARLREVGG